VGQRRAAKLRLSLSHPADIRPHHQCGEQREDNSEPEFHSFNLLRFDMPDFLRSRHPFVNFTFTIHVPALRFELNCRCSSRGPRHTTAPSALGASPPSDDKLMVFLTQLSPAYFGGAFCLAGQLGLRFVSPLFSTAAASIVRRLSSIDSSASAR
jgi:hypothetical protein